MICLLNYIGYVKSTKRNKWCRIETGFIYRYSKMSLIYILSLLTCLDWHLWRWFIKQTLYIDSTYCLKSIICILFKIKIIYIFLRLQSSYFKSKDSSYQNYRKNELSNTEQIFYRQLNAGLNHRIPFPTYTGCSWPNGTHFKRRQNTLKQAFFVQQHGVTN